MKLNEDIVKKYNNLIQEVVSYYDLASSMIIMPSTNLLYPYTFNWDISNTDSITDNMLLLRKDYPYLEPFYKIFVCW